MNAILRRAIDTSRFLKNEDKIIPGKAEIDRRIEDLEKEIKYLIDRILHLEIKVEKLMERGRKVDFRNAPLVMIVSLVSSRMNVSVRDLRSARRNARISLARHIFQYLARMHTELSLPTIGAFLNKDHTSVIHGIERVEELRKTDKNLDQALTEMSGFLSEGYGNPESIFDDGGPFSCKPTILGGL